MSDLSRRAWSGMAFLAVAMGLLLFATAGTVRYWQGWGYLAAFLVPSLLISIHLMKHSPALLERRLSAGPAAEKLTQQKIIMCFASISFIALLIVPALDRRFGWSSVPWCVVTGGDVLTLLGFYIVFLVYKANPFASATIEVASDQTVISTGPYGIVRHPMYSGGILLLAGTPLALGSYWGLIPLAFLAPFLIWRLLDEERYLSEHLPGYAEYCQRVRKRLIPGVI